MRLKNSAVCAGKRSDLKFTRDLSPRKKGGGGTSAISYIREGFKKPCGRTLITCFKSCIELVHPSNGVMRFIRRTSDVLAVEAVDLKIGTDWSQLQAVAEETAARTRNTFIHVVHLSCISCASSLIAFWRDTFNDRMPCRALQLHMGSSCSPKNDTNFATATTTVYLVKYGRCSLRNYHVWRRMERTKEG